MNNELQVFNNEIFGNVRVIMVNDEPMMVGKDVAEALGYSNTRDALISHVDSMDKDAVAIPDSMGRLQQTVVINESGMYSLVFGSKLKTANDFKRWVTSKVLPSIRKTGLYATDDTIDKILNNPDFGIALLTKLKEERIARTKAEQTVAILTHVNKTYTMTEIAKELNMKSAQELNNELSERKIQYKQNGTWVLYSKYSSLGYEEIKQDVLDSGKVIYSRRITQRGREFILNLLEVQELPLPQ